MVGQQPSALAAKKFKETTYLPVWSTCNRLPIATQLPVRCRTGRTSSSMDLLRAKATAPGQRCIGGDGLLRLRHQPCSQTWRWYNVV